MSNISISRQNNTLLKDMALKQLEMATDVSILKNKVGSLDASNIRILSYLDDDDKTGKKGIYSDVYELKQDVYKLKGYKNLIAGVGAVIIATGGIVFGFFKWIIPKL